MCFCSLTGALTYQTDEEKLLTDKKHNRVKFPSCSYVLFNIIKHITYAAFYNCCTPCTEYQTFPGKNS